MKTNLFRQAVSLSTLIANSAFALDPAIERDLAANGQADIIVSFVAQADTAQLSVRSVPINRPKVVFEALRDAAQTDRRTRDALRSRGLVFRDFWIVNSVALRADGDTIAWLQSQPDVREIASDSARRFTPPMAEPGPWPSRAVEASLTLIGAPTVWAMGYRGQNVVIAGQDTGYQWDHPALVASYRGNSGTSVSHDYNWHDSVQTGGLGSCPAQSPIACDDNNHGTHTMGTMVGDDGTGNQIGVAPGARWIGCRNMDRGDGRPSTYIDCMQWMLAPTDLTGNNPRPDLAPDVINNSWGCPESETCTDPNVLRSAVENLRNAGILFVASAGNSGSSCSSIVDPPAIYEASFTVGASNNGDSMASFSSRGPVTRDGSGRMKPDIVAPGVGIRSSIRGGGYSSFSGTSMAGPHVAGVAALVLSANPALRRQPAMIEQILRSTARNIISSSQVCGGVTPPLIPNPVYGMGRLDAVAAVQAAIGEPPIYRNGFESP